MCHPPFHLLSVSVVTSHGHQDAIPHLRVNEGGAGLNTPESTQRLTGLNDTQSRLATPNSVTDGAIPSTLSKSTPPPSVGINDTPGTDNQTGKKLARGSRSTARKRLTYGSDDELDESKLTEDSQEEDPAAKTLSDGFVHTVAKSNVSAKARGVETKRSRGTSPLPQESG